MKCGTQDIGTGTRTIVAMVTAETLGLPVSAVKPEIGDTQLSVQRRIGRQHDGGVGRRRRFACTPGKALDALFAKVAPTLGVDADRRSSRRTAASR